MRQGKPSVCVPAHLTLPIADAMGPLPLPPQAGGEGDLFDTVEAANSSVGAGRS